MTQVVRSINHFYKTTGSFDDFFLEVFSDDLAKFQMPENNEFSCSTFTDSPLDFLIKFHANRNINPQKFIKEELVGALMPKKDSNGSNLNYNFKSPGQSIHFKSIVDLHCDYIAKDEKELRDVATI